MVISDDLLYLGGECRTCNAADSARLLIDIIKINQNMEDGPQN